MLMKRVVGAAVALVCVGLLSSCALLPSIPGTPEDDNSKQQSDVVMQHIADTVKDHDAAALKKLFTPPARAKATNLDSGLNYFLSLFPSGRMTWKLVGISSKGPNAYPGGIEEVFATYKVSADGKKYDLYFSNYSENAADPANVGIYALGVAPYTPDPRTASGNPKPLFAWESTGDPGVYVPQK